MHHYHDQHGHLPPAVALGSDGQTPHSWRVELLPFLEAEHLYDQYRMDEPWDSVNNRKVLDAMPDVFRHPRAPDGVNETAYFALTGSGTVFRGSRPTRFSDI